MGLPEKIYCGTNYNRNLCYSSNQFPNSKEYTRTDTFIKQMKAWLMDNSANYMMYDPLTSSACLEVEKMIDNFEKYMKGE